MSPKLEPESPDDIAETRVQTALREEAGELVLSGLGLTSLPESLGKLTSLQTLDFSAINSRACRSGSASSPA